MPALGEIRHALWFKLTAAFLLVAAAGVIIVAILANRATTVGFRHYLNQDVANQWAGLQAQLASYYERQGNWVGVESLLVAPGPGRGQGGGSLVLLGSDGQIVALAGGRRNYPTSPAEADVNIPITVGGQQVGTLLVKQPGGPGGGAGGGAGEQFLVQVNNAIWWGGLAAVLLALFLGLFLARRLTQPLRQLTEATRKMTRGELGQQVSTAERGEIGELSTSFNQMSVALAASEKQRQQMLADVAHELRTPLSITQGHIEAMLDGVFEMTPENLALVHEETLLLGRLVDDLRTLSLAEAGQLSLNCVPVNLSDLMVQTVTAFEPLAEAEGVELAADVPADAVMVTADPNRIRQVLGNLLSNALRHVSAAENGPPQVTLSLFNRGDVAQLHVSDNGPGLSLEAQQHIFDRFWRADPARSRNQGGSGLGLAICQAIVDAHDGRIWVESTAGQGATFIVELPAAMKAGQ
ncbi:MAG: ATP-binding protein [Chloroflexota bacterium]|jgi:signal transduction histidine kinase